MPASVTTKDVEPLAYSVGNAATALDVCPRTIWNLIERKRLRTVKIGRRTLIPASEVRGLIEGGVA